MTAETSTKKIRIGVAGLGAVAQSVHLPLILRRWDLFELVAVADLSLANGVAIGGQFGIAPDHVYPTLGAMLDAEELDGVVLLTSGSHGGPALEALERGVAVFCEKPLAYSVGEIDRLLEAEQAAGKPRLLLAYMKEYDPAVLALKERLPEPAEIRYVNVEVLHPSGASQLEFANLRPAPRDVDPATIAELVAHDRTVIADALGDEVAAARGDLYANVVLGSLVHDISLVRALVGQIKTVDDVSLWAEQDAPGSIEITGTIGENARVHLHWHYLADYPHYRETVTIHHTKGSLELEFTVPYLLNAPTELRIVTKTATGNSHELVRSVDEAFEAELVAFHRMVTEGIEPPTRAEHGRLDVLTGQRILAVLAAKSGLAIGGEAAALS
jgi:predicted dehydrogenase